MYKAIRIALDEVGYHEKNSPENLDLKTAPNDGRGNYTKYARDLDALGDFYNTPKQGYEWCEVFCDFCFVTAYGKSVALKMLYQPRRSAGAGCEQSVGYYKANGAFFKTPKVGDQIYFTYGSGTADHTGLVWSVDDTYVYTVEGNNGNCVNKHRYAKTNRVIYGYGRPNYALAEDADKEPTPDPTPEPEPPKESEDVQVTLQTLKKGSTGEQVKTLQALLIKKFGISLPVYGMDGDFGNETKAAVITFQAHHGLITDAIVGEKTWKKLLG